MSLLSNYSKIPISFGGASISGEGAGYGFGDIDRDNAISLLRYAFEKGIKIYDTAPIYGFGESEKRIGQAFKQNREDVFIISKSGVTWDKSKRVDMTNDPEVTKNMLEQSLRDLNTDYIDLFMIHWPDANVDIRRPIEVLAKAKQEGKINHIGLCNSNKQDYISASSIERIEVMQSQLNFFERDVANDIFPLCEDNDLSFMSWGSLDKGILTGRVTRDRKFDQSDCRSWAPWWKAMDKEPRYKTMEKIAPLLKEHGHTGLELALSYNLSFNEVSSLLCGTRNQGQLDSLLAALENRLTPELLNELISLSEK